MSFKSNLMLQTERARVYMGPGLQRTIGVKTFFGCLDLGSGLDLKRLDGVIEDALSECEFISEGEVIGIDLSDEDLVSSISSKARHWLKEHGVNGPLTGRQRTTPLTCWGASFHHDADAYPYMVFAVVNLGEDCGWDLYFPATGAKMELHRGSIALFDSALVHGVVRRGETEFHAKHFKSSEDSVAFLSLDMDMAQSGADVVMGINHEHVNLEAIIFPGEILLSQPSAGLSFEPRVTFVDACTGAWRQKEVSHPFPSVESPPIALFCS